jgi:uncharacterized protein YndB with AHSA1/START domain
MIELRFEADVNSSADAIFDVLTDLRRYDRWLTGSSAYPGTTEVSTDPVALGTTYVECASQGVRRGTVTEFEPPVRVAFRQPMTMKPRLLGVIDIEVGYTLTATAGRVHIGRVVQVDLPVRLRPARMLVLRGFRAESERTLLALKAFAEARV